MFYSTDILALKNKTSLAYLFYISTTDNKLKRISKKEIDTISITSTLIILKNPPQPFALRLYAVLMKGLVKLYAVKIRHIEADISTLHKSFMHKPSVRKGKKVKKLEMRVVFDNVNADDFNEFIYNIDNSMQGMTSVENIMINETMSLGQDNYINDNTYSNLTVARRANERIIDDKISMPDAKVRIRNIEKASNRKHFKHNPYFDFYIINEISRLVKGLRTESAKCMDVEAIRKDSSHLFMPQTSTSFLNQDYFEHHDFGANNSNECQYVDIENVINENQETDFQAEVKNSSKYNQGIAFLKVLELLNKKCIAVSQEEPYGTITIKKIEP